MSIGVLLRGFIGDMMDFGDVILYTLFPSFMTIQACTAVELAPHVDIDFPRFHLAPAASSRAPPARRLRGLVACAAPQ